ncbi:MAG: biotin--[acetyl-CoA-carboxylase] ligase [Thermoplasmata archaeon]
MIGNIVRRDVVDSTNEVAKELVAEAVAPWTVVVAEKQVEGRGRSGRAWVSPRGGLYLSVIVQEDLQRLPMISLTAGVAVVDTLRDQALKATIKWPNDVLIGGAKVAGVLVEGIVGPQTYWAIVGIGVNSDFALEALPRQIRENATTLRHELGGRVDNELLLQSILDSFQSSYPAPGEERSVVARYNEVCSTLGKEVRVETNRGIVNGKAVEVGASGFLMLETKNGQRMELAEGSILSEG